jgi:hypothetical protein
MFALDAASRTALAAAAFAAFGAAFVTTPIVARGAAEAVPAAAPSVVPLPARTALADIQPRRDPFAGGDVPAARPIAAPHVQTAMPATPPLLPIPAALRPLPPNAGAGDAAFPFADGTHTGAVVTAIITGPHPFAIVDEAGTTRILTVGDHVDGDSIVAIDGGGVRLSGGTLLAVARASDPVLPHARPVPGGR